MTQATAWAEIVKTEKQADGTLFVYGKVSDSGVDRDEQICDPTWLKTALPEWYRTGGNIREQHSTLAAGTAVQYEEKPDGHYIKALVVDPTSVLKVDTKVLKGFSVGIKRPRVVIDKVARGGRIVDGRIVEVSLVDRPCNPACTLTIVKADAAGRPVHVDQEYRDAGVPQLTWTLDKADERTTALTAVALRSLAELIAGEASSLADGNWGETYDISRLMNAVSSLRDFSYSEAAETPTARTEPTSPGLDLSGSVSTTAAAAISDALKTIPSPGGTPTPATMPGTAVALKTESPVTETAKPAEQTAADTATAAEDATKTEQTAAADADTADANKGDLPTPEYLTKADVTTMVNDGINEALTKALEPLTTKVAELLAKVEATPADGGPQITRTATASKAADAHDTALVKSQIADLTAKSEAASDPALRDGYAKRAADLAATLTK